MRDKIRVVELFSGVGGLSYGFSKNIAFEILAANEIEKDIAIAYSLNYPNVKMINKDICDVELEDFSDIVKSGNIDLVIGGPPCQSYSTLGKRRMDERANLFKQYKRLLHMLNPKAFIFENVVGILSMDNGMLFIKIRKEFEELGYKLEYKVLNAVEFGVPQMRERVFLVGIKGDMRFEFPETTHGEGKTPFVNMEDALKDLPVLKSGESSCEYASLPDNDFLKFVRNSISLSEHNAPNNGAHLIKIMETLKDGQSKNDLPEEIRPKSGYGNTYAKLWWKRPSTTITRNFACPSSSRCIHPRDSRAMTIREGARLQSFPDNYIFYGSDSTKRLEIGNAVPPLLSIHIANQVQKMFEYKQQ
ncbi:MAG: Modification methylase HaeIII [Firmicutes bacterium ADurb.Bin193]|nr:MAG: Modification methylase HaeIII [Firmicutes bacterium ADurb.Bin193]